MDLVCLTYSMGMGAGTVRKPSPYYFRARQPDAWSQFDVPMIMSFEDDAASWRASISAKLTSRPSACFGCDPRRVTDTF
jgi:hypothetical protein